DGLRVDRAAIGCSDRNSPVAVESVSQSASRGADANLAGRVSAVIAGLTCLMLDFSIRFHLEERFHAFPKSPNTRSGIHVDRVTRSDFHHRCFDLAAA